MLSVQILFISLVPLLGGYIVNRKLELNISLQWIIGLFAVSAILMAMHGYGFSKNNTFGVLYVLSVIGLLLYVKDMSSEGWSNYYARIKTRLLSLSLADLIFISVVSLFLIEAISEVLRHPLSAGDALAYWYQKAKFLYFWEDIVEFPTISYPNLGSSVWMLGMNFHDGSESVGRSMFPVVASAVFMSVWLLFRNTVPVKGKELLFLSLFFSYVFIYLITSTFGGSYRYVSSGYVDWMVGAIPAMAYIFLILDLVLDKSCKKGCEHHRLNLRKSSLLFFLISCASIIKMEGYVLTSIYVFSYFFTLLLVSRKTILQNKLKIIVILIFVVFISSLYMQILYYNDIRFVAAQSFGFHDLYSLIERMPLIFKYFATHIAREADLILPFLIAAFLIYRSDKRYILVPILLPIVLYFGFMVSVYLLTQAPLDWHLATSFERLFHQISYMYIFGSILLLFVRLSKV